MFKFKAIRFNAETYVQTERSTEIKRNLKNNDV